MCLCVNFGDEKNFSTRFFYFEKFLRLISLIINLVRIKNNNVKLVSMYPYSIPLLPHPYLLILKIEIKKEIIGVLF